VKVVSETANLAGVKVMVIDDSKHYSPQRGKSSWFKPVAR